MRIKDKDRQVLSGIRAVIKDRPTYGYKRVTALYNRGYPKNVLFHSDRGSEYSSLQIQGLLKQYSFKASMSRTGNC